MALKETLFRVELDVADIERHHYQTYKLMLARHPSEKNERMMLRLLVFAMNADRNLEFTRGFCVSGEPELWHRDDDGTIKC